MGLILPDVLVTLGPQWASEVNDAFSRVDTHDHTTGKGTKVPISAVTINSAIDMQSAYDLINARSLRFVNHAAVLSLPTDIGSIYESGGNLWYNNSTGTPVQITSGSGLAFASLGTIGGDYGPGDPAEVTYSALTSTYIFTQDPGIAGHIACGDVYVYEPVLGGKYARLYVETGLAANVDIQLPNYSCTLAGSNDVAPVGAVIDFAGSTPPTSWLLCYGQTLDAVANPQYAVLFTVIGTTYGGTGIDDFKIPDCRGRVGVGRDDMGGSAAGRITTLGSGLDGLTLGAVGGDQQMTHEHTVPVHSHAVAQAVTQGMNTVAGAGSEDSADYRIRDDNSLWVNRVAGDRHLEVTNGTDSEGQHDHIVASHSTGDPVYTAPVTSSTTGITNDTNVQPSLIFNKIIKY